MIYLKRFDSIEDTNDEYVLSPGLVSIDREGQEPLVLCDKGQDGDKLYVYKNGNNAYLKNGVTRIKYCSPGSGMSIQVNEFCSAGTNSMLINYANSTVINGTRYDACDYTIEGINYYAYFAELNDMFFIYHTLNDKAKTYTDELKQIIKGKGCHCDLLFIPFSGASFTYNDQTYYKLLYPAVDVITATDTNTPGNYDSINAYTFSGYSGKGLYMNLEIVLFMPYAPEHNITEDGTYLYAFDATAYDIGYIYTTIIESGNYDALTLYITGSQMDMPCTITTDDFAEVELIATTPFTQATITTDDTCTIDRSVLNTNMESYIINKKNDKINRVTIDAPATTTDGGVYEYDGYINEISRVENGLILEIPEYAELANDAFYCNTFIYKVVLPKTLSTIINQAFYGASSLEQINLKNIRYISANAFYMCESLHDIDLRNVETLGTCAFYMCRQLKNIILSNKLMAIADNAFAETDYTFGYNDEYSIKNIKYIGTTAEFLSILPVYPYHYENLPKSIITCNDGIIYNKLSVKIEHDGQTYYTQDFYTDIDTAILSDMNNKITVINCEDYDQTSLSNVYSQYTDETKRILYIEYDNIIDYVNIHNYASLHLYSCYISEGFTTIYDMAFMDNNLHELYIPTSITTIGGSIFREAATNDDIHVYYAGSEEQWNNITKDENWSDDYTIVMHYNS